MRVLLVTPRFTPDVGGVETHVLKLTAELAAIGHRVTVVCCADRALPRCEQIAVPGGSITVRRARRPRLWPVELPSVSLLWVLWRESRDSDVAHLHSYHALAALFGAFAARCPKVATLHSHGTGHTPLRTRLHRIYRPLGRWLVRRCDRVIAVSEAERRLLERDFAADLASPPVVIHNGTDPLPSAEPYRGDVPTVLAVCRLEPYKRVDVLVAARAASTAPWRLVVVGAGPERERLEALGCGGVEFLGRVSDEELSRWYASANLVVSASQEESFGLTVAQALQAGVRCLASDIPPHRELVETYGAGHLVSGDDPSQWATRIEEALHIPTPTPAALPDWSAVARRVAAVYSEVVK